MHFSVRRHRAQGSMPCASPRHDRMICARPSSELEPRLSGVRELSSRWPYAAPTLLCVPRERGGGTKNEGTENI